MSDNNNENKDDKKKIEDSLKEIKEFLKEILTIQKEQTRLLDVIIMDEYREHNNNLIENFPQASASIDEAIELLPSVG